MRSFAVVAVLGGILVAGACESPEVSGRASVAPDSDGVFLWRGFEHRWSYNHRLNRLGDYLRQEECSTHRKGSAPRIKCAGTLHHTGASGTGADELAFVSAYSEVGAPEAAFHPVEAELHFDGREQREIRREQTLDVSVDLENVEGMNFVALLNGYDLQTVGKAKAKKVKRFRIWADDQPSYDADDGEVSFEVGGILDVNCDSVECKTQGNRVHYRLDVRAVLIASRELQATARRFETYYRWSRRAELQRDGISLNRNRQVIRGRPEKYPVGLLGFREIDFNLGKHGKYKDHWFVAWQQSIGDVEYRGETGQGTFDLNLFFKEWNSKTKRKATSIARSGTATLRSELVLVQFPGGHVRQKEVSGTLEWPGRNRSPDDPAAEWSKEIGFEF